MISNDISFNSLYVAQDSFQGIWMYLIVFDCIWAKGLLTTWGKGIIEDIETTGTLTTGGSHSLQVFAHSTRQ
jgi:hypothetical protein